MLEKFPKEVKLVHLNFPLSTHKFAKKAAAAAIAAQAQGKFWEYHEKLFENQKHLNDAKFRDLAKVLGLDLAKFHEHMNDPATKEAIARDMRNGRQLGVRSVPTVFINGKRLRNRSLYGFRQMVEAELKKRK